MKERTRFLDRPGSIRLIRIVFAVVLAVLAGLDLVIHKHAHFSWEIFFGAYAVYGFLSCVVIVVVSKVLGKVWLQKGEDYYDR